MSIFGRVAALAAGTGCRGCGASGQMLCADCAALESAARAEHAWPGIDRALARWAYEGIPRALVLDLKLRGTRSAAGVLAEGLAELVRAEGLRADVLTWVPGRPSETRVRGFDHAHAIAIHLSRAIGVPARPLLVRTGSAADQTSLSASARRENLKGVFSAAASPSRVAVVDDVVTTGATAQACAMALRSVGARHVELIAACRA